MDEKWASKFTNCNWICWCRDRLALHSIFSYRSINSNQPVAHIINIGLVHPSNFPCILKFHFSFSHSKKARIGHLDGNKFNEREDRPQLLLWASIITRNSCDTRTLQHNRSTHIDTTRHGYGCGIRTGHPMRKMDMAFSHTPSISPQLTQIWFIFFIYLLSFLLLFIYYILNEIYGGTYLQYKIYLFLSKDTPTPVSKFWILTIHIPVY